MTVCVPALAEAADGSHEPYRAVLRRLREQLKGDLQTIEAALAGASPDSASLLTREDLWQPLSLCYHSLQACVMQVIADALAHTSPPSLTLPRKGGGDHTESVEGSQ